MENNHYTAYVYFNIHTKKPTALMSSGSFANIEANKGPDEVYTAITDTRGWENLRLVDINTLEITREEPENG